MARGAGELHARHVVSNRGAGGALAVAELHLGAARGDAEGGLEGSPWLVPII